MISKEASIVFSDGFEHGQTPAAQDMALEEALGDLKAAVLSATEDLRKQAKHQEVATSICYTMLSAYLLSMMVLVSLETIEVQSS